MRIGMGYDTHRLVDRRKLVLGGVEVPYYRGLIGNSDADVLLHALCDALLGAIGEGDLGRQFPPSDPQYTDISSLTLLEKVMILVKGKGYQVSNADSTIIAEKPKLVEFLPRMVENIARVLGVSPTQISVKATTADGQGAVGKGLAIAAQAVVIVEGGGASSVPPPSAPSGPKDFFSNP